MTRNEIQQLIAYADHYHINVTNGENYDGSLEVHYGIFQSVKMGDDIPFDEAKAVIRSIVRLYPIAKIENHDENKIIEILKHKNIIDLEVKKLLELQQQHEKDLRELIGRV